MDSLKTGRETGRPAPAPRVHLIISTHTTRHLAVCIASLAAQVRPPDTVVVTSDSDDDAIGRLLDEIWPRVMRVLMNSPRGQRGRRMPSLVHTFRPHQGEARLNQVRNNGLRALEMTIGIGRPGAMAAHDLVVAMDGDTMLEPSACKKYTAMARSGFELVIPYRVNLDEARTDQVSAESILRFADATAAAVVSQRLSEQDFALLEDRHGRYVRQLAIAKIAPRGLEVVKPHKPKVLGGHHAVSVGRLRAINGYDEHYTGYGYDDDDLSRRLHAMVPRPKTMIAVRNIIAWHLWHPTRAPSRPTEAPGYARFSSAELPVAAECGWRNPMPQPQPVVRVVPADAVVMSGL